jgi:ABC-type polysaccharide/polyol phosphate transport system ATPase subunit
MAQNPQQQNTVPEAAYSGSLLSTPSEVRKPAVQLVGVSKIYSRKVGRSFLRTHLAGWLRRTPAETFYALRDVSLEVMPGESLAVIGPNGAGKSTLLSLVAGVSYPNQGRVAVNGTVAALLELGSGFHPDLTGAENVFLNASLLGMTRKKVLQCFDRIVEFSGIGDFINEPLRTYSTGMIVRLAFSVLVEVELDILIIDEVLTVGDRAFQAKCVQKMLQFKRAGKTLLCVSHATEILKQLCDRALWLSQGETVMYGKLEEVIEAYVAT